MKCELALALCDKRYHPRIMRTGADFGEIDLIAWAHDKLLVFVEVKTRSSDLFGGGEGAITLKKQKVLLRTAGAYMESIGYEWAVRFDVVVVKMKRGIVEEIRHHEDAFF